MMPTALPVLMAVLAMVFFKNAYWSRTKASVAVTLPGLHWPKSQRLAST